MRNCTISTCWWHYKTLLLLYSTQGAALVSEWKLFVSKMKWARYAGHVSTVVGVPRKNPEYFTLASHKQSSFRCTECMHYALETKTAPGGKLQFVKMRKVCRKKKKTLRDAVGFVAKVGQWDVTHKQAASCQDTKHSLHTRTPTISYIIYNKKTHKEYLH